MNKLQTLSSIIEQLEKEISYLIKKKIPALKEEIIDLINQGTTPSYIKSIVSDFLDELLSSQSTIISINDSLEELKNKNVEIENKLSSTNNTIDEQEKIISQINEQISSLIISVDAITDKASSLQNSLDELKLSVSQNSSDISDLTISLEDTRASMTAMSQRVSSLENSLTELTQSQAEIATSLEETKASMTSIAQRTSNCESSIGQLSSSQAEISNSLEETRASMAAISQKASTNENEISSLKTQVSGYSSDISSIKTKTSSLENNFSSLNTQIQEIDTSLESTRASMTSISQRVTQCEKDIDSLSGQGGGSTSTENVDLIYDMGSSDSSINQGLLEGIYGGKMVSFDYNKYKKLRVYASLKNRGAITEMYLENKIRDDLTLSATSMMGRDVFYLSISSVASMSKFAVSYRTTITYTPSTSEITYSTALTDKDFYVYRLEGIY